MERLFKIMTPEEEAQEEADREAELYLERNEHLELDIPKSENEMLVEILENTQKVKTVIVDKVEKAEKAKAEKAEKSKSAKSKAEAKFKMVGTKLNEVELKEFETKLDTLDTNSSQYFKKLIKFDLIGNEELLKRQEKSIEDYKLKYENELSKVLILNKDKEALEAVIKQKQTELDKELTKTFMERLRALF